METEDYLGIKLQLKMFFQQFVDAHSLKECIEFYFRLEGTSQEDALLFAVPMIERYINSFEDDIYDHIGCMVFHDGNNGMLTILLKAQMATKNDRAKEYYQSLIENLVSGLQQTARTGFQYDEKYLDGRREEL